MPYDEYGWILNWDIKNQCFKDRGDSCFFMGLQTLCFLLQNKEDEAKELYYRVKKYDFVRHPSVLQKETAKGYWKNQTSYDMLVIWDYLANRFKYLGWLEEPPYHYRRSRYFWGKFRNPLMYLLPLGYLVLKIFSFLLNFRFFRKQFLYEHYRVHLVMLYFGVVLEKSNSMKFLRNLRKLVKKIEEYSGFENHFFRFIARMDIRDFWKPQHNCWEWVYQRNIILGCNERKDDVIFHYEKIEVDGKVKELDMSEQFWYFWVKNFIKEDKKMKKIKKAVEHYENFLGYVKEFGEKEAVEKLLFDFLDELEELTKIRNAQTFSAIKSIVLELNQKWNTLRKFDPLFKENGFLMFIEEKTGFKFKE